MRLQQIKLAGFKSFVDPTIVKFPANRSAVVGPNGCGKSNIIDAVRWVMGESSAKQLRGESMTDVIFNGSSARKATSMATIELLFDNSDGRIGGEYSGYADIAIRRTLSRDAQSSYFINAKKVRRRDVLDVFLGTGFGPRSYSIIEQGMISQLVDAKPEELRVYLEEAAGISKYKERRRETENRIRHTVENLERLNDIREELAKQLARLKRQANAAAQYRGLKDEQRTLTGQLHSLRLTTLRADLQTRQAAIGDLENRQAERSAQIQNVATKIEKARLEHVQRNEKFNSVQGSFYKLGADIARVEEALQYNQQRLTQLQLDLETVSQRNAEATRQLEMDDARILEFTEQIDALAPELDKAREADEQAGRKLAAVEEQLRKWQSEWDEFSAAAAQSEQTAQVQAARIDHVENLLQRLRGRDQQLQIEADAEADPTTVVSTDQVGVLAAKIGQAEQAQRALEVEVASALSELASARDATLTHERELELVRSEVNALRHDLASLEALQRADLGRHNGDVQNWLQAHKLSDGARLGEQLSVVPGWELAVEAVLGADLQAIRVNDLDTYAADLPNLPSGRLTLFEGSTELASDGELPLLATFARGEKLGLGALLDGIYAAESIQVAQSHRRGLANSESIITRDGLWFGRDWVRAIRGEADEMGIIQRAQEIDNLSIRLEEADAQLAELQGQLGLARERVPKLEAARDDLQQRSGHLDRTLGQLRADFGVKQVRIEEAESRRERLASDRTELATQVDHEAQVLIEAQGLLAAAQSAGESSKATRTQLLRHRDDTTAQLDDVRRAARAAHDKFHALNGERGGLQSHLAASRTARDRLVSQRSELVERSEAIANGIESSQQPLPELQQELADRLEERLGVEQAVAELRNGLDEVDGEIRAAQEQLAQHEAGLETVRGDLENARVIRQGLIVQQDNLQELLTATGLDFATLCAEMPAGASDTAWKELLEKMERRINRLGPINLAAIDEFETQSERKTYLDAQFADLEEALETLQGAIRKIDKETRARFKATFEAVDKRLGELFPKVFGGGHASLELTGEDLLDSGVSLMARPPGKRNSSIHLLSGGEKALTAIALIFAIFQLNPSPVCLLDEVDAPLDDSNVQRFADLIKEMSAEVQFVVVTHNKITMEMADHLMGVTMHEAGVSRLVSVDVEEAAELAAI